MNEANPFERRLAAGLEAYVGPRRSVDAVAITASAASPLPLTRSIRIRVSAAVTPAPRLAWLTVGVVALLIVALAVGAIMAGGGRQAFPAVVGPAANGLIAYSSDGDIYVGDAVTGQTTAIVTGTAVDSSAKFSPDGSRIAFARGNPWGDDASIIVVRADGSDERIAKPSGSKHGIEFIWTPNGASLLVNHDSEPSRGTDYYAGELSLFDASGVAEPRLLTPPLPIAPGGPYFKNTAQVAPMFRPPNGDLILSHASDATVPTQVGGHGLYVWDAALESHTLLEPEALKGFAPYSVSPWDLWWSPDGSMIAFGVWGNPAIDGFYVMKADGSDVRRLEVDALGNELAWSPDGTRIAYKRGCPDPGRQGAVIVILDVASGAERVLDATTVETKIEGTVPRPPPEAGPCYGGWILDTEGRAWDYEGWSWSPDGRSIVVLERHGTRPMVVDVESGQATYLPWEADSPPSWQRIRGR